MSQRPKIKLDLTRTAVGEALERARTVALRQLRLFEERAALAVFTDREASAFQRMVNSLAAIEREQRERAKQTDLSGLKEDDLAQLEDAARATLGLPHGATQLDAVDLVSQAGYPPSPSRGTLLAPLPQPEPVSPQAPGGGERSEGRTHPSAPKTFRSK